MNGERRVVPGEIFDSMSGTNAGTGLNSVLTNAGYYKVRTSTQERGKDIHKCIYTFPTLNKSEFCVGCHQVAVHPGIKLEVVWEQFRDSPAFRAGACAGQAGRLPYFEIRGNDERAFTFRFRHFRLCHLNKSSP